MYILRCSNGSYYTGSTVNLEIRILQHNHGEGSNYTKKHLPVELVYFELFQRIEDAFHREKQYRDGVEKRKNCLLVDFTMI
ncbi:GIY-YIG nuclease family protein [Sphingobacterium daejeonense]|uniref:GIY-YIG nuclease family protein n=1 Tax=Sphingobacterium daejeonense TaxID=371142 RepID=UPI0010C282FA|nr:GIY-YIG nuclease family protein [Sphingobacterium daejeonense]VTP98681.1 GIY-YIG nuclease superfamily protein [Sphingobacterium daejeonense]